MNAHLNARLNSPLPTLLAEIADVVADATGDDAAGLDAAMAIARARGGQRVRILPDVDDNQWLVAAVGRRVATIIVGLYSTYDSGEQIDIPMGTERGYMGQRRSRSRIIADGIAKGLPVSDIARHAECTERYVWWFKKRMLGKPSIDPRQMTLI